MFLLSRQIVCSKEDALDSECSTNLTASGNKFREIRLSLEIPLELAGQTLQCLDSDLAEFASQLHMEAIQFADCIERGVHQTETNGLDGHKDQPEGGSDSKVDSGPQGDLANDDMLLAKLRAQLKSLRQRILYLTMCTEVVHDAQFMMYTQQQLCHRVKLGNRALEQLHHVNGSLKALLNLI